SVLLGNGDGTFQPPRPYLTGPGPSAVTASDFNGDGADDLAVANQYDGTVTVLLSTGDGTAQTEPAHAAGPTMTTHQNGCAHS
ncbi:FG-GAP repeat domain-containing protein, partial [Parafrankia colletiae]|uniref:FG-GAP repeat domain-containing protein n=1 Tax=Parafrankia colletiae TaxID=573497 RepID=UPI0010426EAB